MATNIIRGGTWLLNQVSARSANRYWINLFDRSYCVGFRVLEEPQSCLNVIRGQSWLNFQVNARSAYRYRDFPNDRIFFVGFRVLEEQQ